MMHISGNIFTNSDCPLMMLHFVCIAIQNKTMECANTKCFTIEIVVLILTLIIILAILFGYKQHVIEQNGVHVGSASEDKYPERCSENP